MISSKVIRQFVHPHSKDLHHRHVHFRKWYCYAGNDSCWIKETTEFREDADVDGETLVRILDENPNYTMEVQWGSLLLRDWQDYFSLVMPLSYLPYESWYEIVWIINRKAFIQWVQSVGFCVRPGLYTVFGNMYIHVDKGETFFVGTSGSRLCEFRTPNCFMEEQTKVLIPLEHLPKLLAFLDMREAEDITVYQNNKFVKFHIQVGSREAEIHIQTDTQTFPDYRIERIMPSTQTGSVTYKAKDLKNAMTKVLAVNKWNTDVKIDNGLISAHTRWDKGVLHSNVNVSIECTVTGETRPIMVNAKYLLEVCSFFTDITLKHCPERVVRIDGDSWSYIMREVVETLSSQ